MRLPEGECVPFCLGVWRGCSPPHRQENLGLVRGSKWPQTDHKVTCYQRWKAFDSISIHWEVAAVWNQFWWKKQRKIVILAFLRYHLIAMVAGNLRLSMLLQRQWSRQHLCQVWLVLKQFLSFDSNLNLYRDTFQWKQPFFTKCLCINGLTDTCRALFRQEQVEHNNIIKMIINLAH
jgi:hypothetical protein